MHVTQTRRASIYLHCMDGYPTAVVGLQTAKQHGGAVLEQPFELLSLSRVCCGAATSGTGPGSAMLSQCLVVLFWHQRTS